MSTNPLGERERIFRPCIWPHGLFHPSEVLSKASSIVATDYGSPQATASTLDFRTGRKYHYYFCLSSPSGGCAAPSESERQQALPKKDIASVFAHVACRFPGSRRKVKDALCIQLSKSHRGVFYPSTPILLTKTPFWTKLFSNFFKIFSLRFRRVILGTPRFRAILCSLSSSEL